MAEDFYNKNMNPITMYKPYDGQLRNRRLENKKGMYVKVSELEGLVNAKAIMYELGIGAKRIKSMCQSFGETPKYNQGGTFYNALCLDKLREILEEDKKNHFEVGNYISNKELMTMFGFTAYKAWEIAKNEKLAKIKISGNVNHFNREKAIEAFAKYKKQP